MILTILLASYTNGGLLFSRFYGPSLCSEPQQAGWLARIREHTAPEWDLLAADHPEQCAHVDDCSILFKRIIDIVLLVVGNREHDALLLLEFGRAFETCFRSLYRLPTTAQVAANNRQSAEKKLLAAYWNVCLLVDEMIDEGSIDHFEAATVLKALDLKPAK